MRATKNKVWATCVWLVMIILAVIYSPLVLRPGVTEPWVLGLPYTLWASLLGAFSIVLVTAIGAFWRPSQD